MRSARIAAWGLAAVLAACAPVGAPPPGAEAGFLAAPGPAAPAVSREALEEVLLRSVALSL